MTAGFGGGSGSSAGGAGGSLRAVDTTGTGATVEGANATGGEGGATGRAGAAAHAASVPANAESRSVRTASPWLMPHHDGQCVRHDVPRSFEQAVIAARNAENEELTVGRARFEERAAGFTDGDGHAFVPRK